MRLKADLLLPVFNSPHLLQNFFDSLLSHSNAELISCLIIGDDCSDAKTQNVIDSFKVRCPFSLKIMRRDKNLGYLRNCNDLYKSSTAPIIILLNSDILVPKHWLERMLAPFEKEKQIALATPFSTSAANLTVKMPVGCSWVDLDHIFQSLPAQFPPACTAIGFCLGIRRAALEQAELFDEFFGEGYGEETDLHYKLLDNGYTSVVVDNLVVHHVGSGSFCLLPALDERKKKNYDLFIERWGKVHFPKAEEFARNVELNAKVELKTNQSKWTYQTFDYDILFVLPILDDKSGGVQVVVDLVERLIALGYRANIIDLGPIDQDYLEKLHFFSPLRPRDLHRVKKAKVVLATHFLTVLEGQKISSKLGASFVYFMQGPETMFDGGVHFATIIKEFSLAKHILCVSEFLVKYVRNYTQNKSIYNIQHGPDSLFFYPRVSGTATRRSKSIAGCLRTIPEKGTGFLLEFFNEAKKRGFEIHLFGQNSDVFVIEKDFATMHGALDRLQLAKLFSTVEYYADFSFFEGLGLLPLEAAFCGAIPIITKTGGSNQIFDSKNSIFLNNIFELDAIWHQLQNMSRQETIEMSQAAQNLRERYSSRVSVPKLVQYLENELSVKPSVIQAHPLIPNSEILETRYARLSARIAELKRIVSVLSDLFKQGGWKYVLGKTCQFIAKRLIKSEGSN